ncbi:hypothetical protein FRC01_001910 [Tulasnella sp. 417]|nr:hypothetical protein FRC01_001910 [Tulasnella sp. 417]
MKANRRSRLGEATSTERLPTLPTCLKGEEKALQEVEDGSRIEGLQTVDKVRGNTRKQPMKKNEAAPEVSNSNQQENQEDDLGASGDDVPQTDIATSLVTSNGTLAGNQLPEKLDVSSRVSKSTRENQQEEVVEAVNASAREEDIRVSSSKPPTGWLRPAIAVIVLTGDSIPPPAEVAPPQLAGRSGASKPSQQNKQKDFSTTIGNAVQQGEITAPPSSNPKGKFTFVLAVTSLAVTQTPSQQKRQIDLSKASGDDPLRRGIAASSSTHTESVSAGKQKSGSISGSQGSNLEYRREEAVQALDDRSVLRGPAGGASSSTNPIGGKPATQKSEANREAQKPNQEDKLKNTLPPVSNVSLHMGTAGSSSAHPGGSHTAEPIKQKDTSHHPNDGVRQRGPPVLVSEAPKGETPGKQLPPEPGPTAGTQEPCHRDNHGDASSTSEFDYLQRYMAGSLAQPTDVSTGKPKPEAPPKALKPNEEGKRKAASHALNASAEPKDPTGSSSSNPKAPSEAPKSSPPHKQDVISKTRNDASLQNVTAPPSLGHSKSCAIQPSPLNARLTSSRTILLPGETTRRHKVEGSPEPQKPLEGDKPKDNLQAVGDGSLQGGKVASASENPTGEKPRTQKSGVNPEAQKPHQENKRNGASEPFDDRPLRMGETSPSTDPRGPQPGTPAAATPSEVNQRHGQKGASQAPNDPPELTDPSAASPTHSKGLPGAAGKKQTRERHEQGPEDYKQKNGPHPKEGALTGSDRMKDLPTSNQAPETRAAVREIQEPHYKGNPKGAPGVFSPGGGHEDTLLLASGSKPHESARQNKPQMTSQGPIGAPEKSSTAKLAQDNRSS